MKPAKVRSETEKPQLAGWLAKPKTQRPAASDPSICRLTSEVHARRDEGALRERGKTGRFVAGHILSRNGPWRGCICPWVYPTRPELGWGWHRRSELCFLLHQTIQTQSPLRSTDRYGVRSTVHLFSVLGGTYVPACRRFIIIYLDDPLPSNNASAVEERR
jgi:hypothetical protein